MSSKVTIREPNKISVKIERAIGISMNQNKRGIVVLCAAMNFIMNFGLNMNAMNDETVIFFPVAIQVFARGRRA